MVGNLHEMGSRGLAQMVLVMLALVAMSYGGAVAQSGCASALTGLVPCLSYVTGGGNSSTPSSSCCSQLASVVQSSPQCLCSVLNGGGVPSLGITVNQTQALALPSACNVNTPPVARCNATTNGPTASSPVSSPVDTSNETPNGGGSVSPSTSQQVPSISGGVGSKVVPSTHDRNTSHRISVMGSGSHYYLAVLIVLITVFASTLTQF